MTFKSPRPHLGALLPCVPIISENNPGTERVERSFNFYFRRPCRHPSEVNYFGYTFYFKVWDNVGGLLKSEQTISTINKFQQSFGFWGWNCSCLKNIRKNLQRIGVVLDSTFSLYLKIVFMKKERNVARRKQMWSKTR